MTESKFRSKVSYKMLDDEVKYEKISTSAKKVNTRSIKMVKHFNKFFSLGTIDQKISDASNNLCRSFIRSWKHSYYHGKFNDGGNGNS